MKYGDKGDEDDSKAMAKLPCCKLCPVGCPPPWVPKPKAAFLSISSSQHPRVYRQHQEPPQLTKPDLCSKKFTQGCCRVCTSAWRQDTPEFQSAFPDKYHDPLTPLDENSASVVYDPQQPDAVANMNLVRHGRDLPWRQGSRLDEEIRYEMEFHGNQAPKETKTDRYVNDD